MGRTALGLYALYVALAFGLRSVVQWRRTGSTGFKGVSGSFGSLEWIGSATFVVALILAPAAALLDATGILEPLGILDHFVVCLVAVVVYVLGLASTLAAQFWMGDSWRIGVDASERTALVTNGPFAYVRNPIFTALLLASAGLALLVPNAVAMVAFLATLVAIEIQVRRVEEPYLLRAQGAAYADYAQRVGRFLPGLGKIKNARAEHVNDGPESEVPRTKLRPARRSATGLRGS